MKSRLMLLILFLIPFGLSAQYPVIGKGKIPKGNITSFTERCYDTSQGISVLISKNTYNYSAEGIPIERKEYDTIDSLKVSQTISYIYEDGELIEEVGAGYKISFAYDDLGNKLAEKYASANTNDVKRFEYNSSGHLVKLVCYSAAGKLLYTHLFKHDNQNVLLKFSYLVPDSISKNYYAVYEVDMKGKRVGERVYAENDFILYNTKFDYDTHGEMTREARYNFNGSHSYTKKYEYIYDKYGNWTTLINKNKSSSYLITRQIYYQ
ncbi:MAG: hypothetical protein EOO85_21210 [Pedobacter sp.]|nr:MAG: hypothetical protein EOO85_21210 [Pedobacter sp.]